MKLSRIIGLTLMHAMMGLVLIGCAKAPKSKTGAGAGGAGSMAGLHEPPGPMSPYGAGSSSGLGGPGGMGADGYGLAHGDALRNGGGMAIPDLRTIYFSLDSYELGGDSVSTLDANAAWMLTNPNVVIQIEGHCDDTGTLEYNLNLGQNRADVVREYLVMAGIPADRLHTISYGEERPVGADSSQNRRVQFLVYDPNM